MAKKPQVFEELPMEDELPADELQAGVAEEPAEAAPVAFTEEGKPEGVSEATWLEMQLGRARIAKYQK